MPYPLRGPTQWLFVGGGIRDDEDLLELLESIVNLVCRRVPWAEIAFNPTPQDISDAVARRLRSI